MRSYKPKDFEIGERVTWTSQAAGSSRKKDGEIVAVVPAGHSPCEVGFPSRGKRKHTSYIVRVQRPRSTTLYWPIVTHLRRARTVK